MRSRQNLNHDNNQARSIYLQFFLNLEAKKKKICSNRTDSLNNIKNMQYAIEKEGVAHETGDFLQRTPWSPHPSSSSFESTAWMETRFLVNQGECLKARTEVDIGGDKP